MPTLLVIHSSADLKGSHTRALTDVVSDAWSKLSDQHRVVTRDLHRQKLPHLDFIEQHQPPESRGASILSREADALQDELLSELLEADALVVGAPMYNFGVPSTLKSWIDFVLVPGATAPSTRPKQPMAGRTVVIITSQGTSATEVRTSLMVDPLEAVFCTAMGMDSLVISADRTNDKISERSSRAFAETQDLCRETTKYIAKSIRVQREDITDVEKRSTSVQ